MPNESRSAKKVFLPPSLLRFWAVLVIITLVSAIRYLWLVKVDHKRGVPIFILLNSTEWFHRDFTVFADNFHHFREPDFWHFIHLDSFNLAFNYPATMALPFAFFYQFPQAVGVYLGFLSLLMVGGAWLWAVRLTARGVSTAAAALFVIAFLASYPFRLELQRANIEGIVVLFTAGAILAFFRRRYWLAATLIGIAGAMKIFPIILLGLLFSVRKYKQMIWGMVAAALANLCSLWLLGPSIGIAHRQITNAMRNTQLIYVESAGLGWLSRDHSLFTLVKLHLNIFGQANAAHLLHAVYPVYLAIVTFSSLLLFFLVIRKLPLLNQVLILTLCAVFFPPISNDYTLLHLSVPFALLCLYVLEAWNAGEKDSAGLNTAMVLFGIIFSDLNFIGHESLMGPTRALAIGLLLVVLLRHPISWPAFDQA